MLRRVQRRGEDEEEEDDLPSLTSSSRRSSETSSLGSLVQQMEPEKALPRTNKGPTTIIWHIALILVLFLMVSWSCYISLKLIDVSDHDDGFVSVEGNRFVKDCRPFYVVGFNAHDVTTAALSNPTSYGLFGTKSGKTHVHEMFQEAAKAGMNVGRIWVHPEDAKFPLQIAPGVYSEEAFQALDFVVTEAGKNGLKLILCLIDTWEFQDGIDQFVDWSSTIPPRNSSRSISQWTDLPPNSDLQDNETASYEAYRRSLFYGDPDCKKMYKDHVETIVTRRNSLTGMLYKDDPTIMGWDLVNEPRCETWVVSNCEQHFQNWVMEMSGYLKELDPQHLVTIGSEGFFGANSTWNHLNPQKWAGELGQDFIKNHLVDNIDFATIHVWPDNWDRTDEGFAELWSEHHMKLSTEVLKKPLLIEEFGRKVFDKGEDEISDSRDPVFHSTYELIENWIGHNNEQAVGGSLFWRWNIPVVNISGQDGYGVDSEDSTYKVVKSHASFINVYINGRTPCSGNCWIRDSGAFFSTCRNLIDHCPSNLPPISSQDSKLIKNSSSEQESVNVISIVEIYPNKHSCCFQANGIFSFGCFL